MSVDIPSRVFARTTSYQHGDELTVVSVLHKSTYRLDKVGQRGVVLRVTTIKTYGTQKATVGWLAVTPGGFRVGWRYDTRRAARRAVEA